MHYRRNSLSENGVCNVNLPEALCYRPCYGPVDFAMVCVLEGQTTYTPLLL